MTLPPGGASERSLSPRRVFLDPDPSLRARRATDCVLLVWSIVGLVGLGVLEDSKPAVESALARLFAALPGWFDSGWLFLSDFPLLWAVVLVVVAVAQRRYRLAGSAGLAVVCAIGLALVSPRVSCWVIGRRSRTWLPQTAASRRFRRPVLGWRPR